jgi:hypothetical protein
MKMTDKSTSLAIKHSADLKRTLNGLRDRLERAFSPSTAAPGFSGSAASTGHCAVVSALLAKLIGATMVSTRLAGQSHWFNRIRVGNREYDIDLTGDQYGLEPVRIANANALYPETRVRSEEDLNADTRARARRLAANAGFLEIAQCL